MIVLKSSRELALMRQAGRIGIQVRERFQRISPLKGFKKGRIEVRIYGATARGS